MVSLHVTDFVRGPYRVVTWRLLKVWPCETRNTPIHEITSYISRMGAPSWYMFDRSLNDCIFMLCCDFMWRLLESDKPGSHLTTQVTAMRKALNTKPRDNFFDYPALWARYDDKCVLATSMIVSPCNGVISCDGLRERGIPGSQQTTKCMAMRNAFYTNSWDIFIHQPYERVMVVYVN